MNNDNRYPWFIFDWIVFLALNILAIWYIRPTFETLHLFTPWIIILLALAVYRGANIISNEKITEPLRAPFVRMVDKEGKKVQEPAGRGFRGAFGTLLYCPSCSGTWVAMVLVYLFVVWPAITGLIIILLALSGMERFLTTGLGVVKKWAE